MKRRNPPRVHLNLAIWLGIAGIVAGCSPEQISSPNTPQPLLTPTIECKQELILPQLTEVQPESPVPGNEITVIGSGGYIHDDCGGFIEGLREFTLYLDQEAAGSLSCYINRCEGKLTLPASLSAGLHCLSVEPDKCTFEFQVNPQ